MPQRVRRRNRLGWGFRVAVFLLWPVMRWLTKSDWQHAERLNETDGGIIVTTNHISYFDPLALAFMLWEMDRPPRFLGKVEVFSIPVIGSIIRSAGQIPVYRETANAVDAVRDAIAAVQEGECVVVYPEGTITRDPHLWPMAGKTGAARVALATGAPLYPVAQWGAQEVVGPYRREFRILPRKTMKLLVGQPVDFSDLRDRPLDADTLSVATDRIVDALTMLLGQIRQEPPPTERFVHHRGGGS
jgi:1-acyl-sn-glycerol-3-phosphate acyltransferase